MNLLWPRWHDPRKPGVFFHIDPLPAGTHTATWHEKGRGLAVFELKAYGGETSVYVNCKNPSDIKGFEIGDRRTTVNLANYSNTFKLNWDFVSNSDAVLSEPKSE